MTYSTLAQIKTRLENECDLSDDAFVDLDVELLGYINSAIDDCEAVIHALYEDYFLNLGSITLVTSTSTYSLPSDIFATKVRAFLFNPTDGDGYPLRKIKKLSETLFYGNSSQGTSVYKYIIVNDVTTGLKVKLYPTPTAQDNGKTIDVWYIRNAKTLSAAADQCDIPEFINFIYAHVKWHVALKERSGINLAAAEKAYLDQRSLLEKTLSEMTPTDDSTEIEKDFSFYNDFDTETELSTT